MEVQKENQGMKYIDMNDVHANSLSSLPRWFLLNTKNPKEYKKLISDYFLLNTTDNGDCLFHSIHLFLISIQGEGKAYTSEELRECVAESILEEKNTTTNDYLDQCRAILESRKVNSYSLKGETMAEYQFAFPLLIHNDGTITKDMRLRIAENMRHPLIYWGNEYALIVLEKALCVNFLTIKKTSRTGIYGYFVGDKKDTTRKTCVLFLDGNHYRPMAKKIQNTQTHNTWLSSVFALESLPSLFMSLLS